MTQLISKQFHWVSVPRISQSYDLVIIELFNAFYCNSCISAVISSTSLHSIRTNHPSKVAGMRRCSETKAITDDGWCHRVKLLSGCDSHVPSHPEMTGFNFHPSPSFLPRIPFGIKKQLYICSISILFIHLFILIYSSINSFIRSIYLPYLPCQVSSISHFHAFPTFPSYTTGLLWPALAQGSAKCAVSCPVIATVCQNEAVKCCEDWMFQGNLHPISEGSLKAKW